MEKDNAIEVHILLTEKEDEHSGTITIRSGNVRVGPEEIDGFFLLSKKGKSPIPTSAITIGLLNEIKEAFTRAWVFMQENDDPIALLLEQIATSIIFESTKRIGTRTDDKGETTH